MLCRDLSSDGSPESGHQQVEVATWIHGPGDDRMLCHALADLGRLTRGRRDARRNHGAAPDREVRSDRGGKLKDGGDRKVVHNICQVREPLWTV
eukprot:778040-Alexandrium_andersonii.AAC.1